jgi:hypothetical protein
MKTLTLILISFLFFNTVFSQKNCNFKVVIAKNVDCTKRNVVGISSVEGIPKKLFLRKKNKINLSGVNLECDLQKLFNLFNPVCKIRNYKLITIEIKKMYDNEDDPSRRLSLFFSYSKH